MVERKRNKFDSELRELYKEFNFKLGGVLNLQRAVNQELGLEHGSDEFTLQVYCGVLCADPNIEGVAIYRIRSGGYYFTGIFKDLFSGDDQASYTRFAKATHLLDAALDLGISGSVVQTKNIGFDQAIKNIQKTQVNKNQRLLVILAFRDSEN